MPRSTRKGSLPDEVVQALVELRRKMVGGIRSEQRIDAADFLRKLARTLDENARSLTQRDAAKVHAALHGWLTRVTAPKKGPARLTNASVQAAGEILRRLTDAFRLPPTSPKGRDPRTEAAAAKKRRTFALGATHTLLAFAKVSDSPRAWASSLRYVDAAFDRDPQAEPSVAALTEEQSSLLSEGLLAAFKTLLTEGDDSALSTTLAILRRHPPLKSSVIEGLRGFWTTNVAVLPARSQRWLQETLSPAHGDTRVDYGQVADRPEIRQAAGLLLFLWDVRATTPQLIEAFDRFRRLAESHFSLFIRGESTVGVTVPYDARLHEIEAAGDENPELPTTVRLLRPRVEYSRPPEAAVIIRGLARPA